MTSPSVTAYLRSRGGTGPWTIDGSRADGFAGAVVIPAYAEGDNLFATLASLARNPPELLSGFLTLVVINNRPDAPVADREDNLTTLRRLAALRGLTSLQLGWVDAATTGRELPPGGGVGVARKIGLDLALGRLAFDGPDPLLVCLDADTLVRPDYLPAIVAHFAAHPGGGAIIPFCHQAGETTGHDEAIVRYELFLRSYVLGLALAGSPYAFHTVGSAMACRASAYVRMGGMNRRVAGEDFYFLQQLHRTVGVAPLTGTVVFPSARSSHRVPFGTGRS
ncbi:MAG TPA: glycosyltransferase family 2 protein, partial [Geobacteraceae bacterium]